VGLGEPGYSRISRSHDVLLWYCTLDGIFSLNSID